jgi:death-on-curing protein
VTRYLRLDDVARQVDRFGFVVGDAGLLAAAMARPQASAFGEDAYPNLWLKAAALCQSIDNNQALVDGNKRLAWSVSKVFLAINGYRLRATADEGETFMIELVAGAGDLPRIVSWLKAHSARATPPEVPEIAD